MKLLLSFLLVASTSFYFQSDVASAVPLGELPKVCEDIAYAMKHPSFPMSNQCVCKNGFEGPAIFSPDSLDAKCFDIDECKNNVMVCGNLSLCVNTIGSFECRPCGQGYMNVQGICQAQLVDAHKECNDIPNAMTDPSVSMSNQCVCKVGFEGPARFSHDSVDAKCVDINECLNQNVCGADLDCMNTQGSYQCICKNGFTNYNATHCEDKDECKDGSANCHAIAACKNQHGFYQCFCPHGYNGSGIGTNGCTDLNECQNAMVCGADAICKNLIGSYECTKCDTGHINVKGFCKDINECSNFTICGANAICKNTIGSYQCTKCDEGYMNVNGKCEDVDECTTGKARCHESANCINKIGSFYCLCPTGFTGSGDVVSGCKDIDECRNDPCEEGSGCVNDAGSFQCYCLEGYSYDTALQRCKAADIGLGDVSP